MRTIKFRGKCTDDGMWRHGDLLHADNLIWINDNGLHCTVDEKTVGQFTGLYDKNGEEIYEGDIIKCGGCNPLLEVRFVRGVFYFLWSGDLDNKFPTGASTHEWAEVVGNIHDNPELLSRSEQA